LREFLRFSRGLARPAGGADRCRKRGRPEMVAAQLMLLAIADEVIE
jgi:hypothetical protein